VLEEELENLKRSEDPEIKELRLALARTQKQLSKARQKTDELVEAVINASKDATLAFGAITPVKDPVKDKRIKNEEVALWHLTDWQGAKKTASYDSEIMRQRVMEFASKAVKITDIQRADHPVKNCVIMFGGDMIEGLFNFPTQSWEVDSSLFGQYINVSRLCVDVVRYALSHYETMCRGQIISIACAMNWRDNCYQAKSV
jgi:hypothetical protein